MADRPDEKSPSLSRRRFLALTAGVGAATAGLTLAGRRLAGREAATGVFIAPAGSYSRDLGRIIGRGLAELGLRPRDVKGKRVLLKPNLVEAHPGAVHVCTHPAVVFGAAEAFWRLGAARVIIGEGSGHCTDPWRTLDQSGLSDIVDRHLPFVDLNTDELATLPNRGVFGPLKSLTLPREAVRADIVVSLAKMKTHHWAGVTLSMKNLFGLMPGRVYGWPKNVLHQAGVVESILDINATFRPHLAIVDGITGMEGDGPLAGQPKPAGVLVMGRDPAAVDATCARVMGIDPWRLDFLRLAAGRLGTVSAGRIDQRGETIARTLTPFGLCRHIPAHRVLLGLDPRTEPGGTDV